jgi:hypothetical protein
MGMCRLLSCLGLALSALTASPKALATETKLGCRDVAAIEARCQEYDSLSKSCDALVQTEGKAKVDAAKQALNACKAKHSYEYMVKCKNEMKKSTTLVNTPKQVLSMQTQKELVGKADTACAKAEAIGNEQKLCKGPKKVIETMKGNCIKDL